MLFRTVGAPAFLHFVNHLLVRMIRNPEFPIISLRVDKSFAQTTTTLLRPVFLAL